MPSKRRRSELKGDLKDPGTSDVAGIKTVVGKKDKRLKKRQDFLSKLQAEKNAVKERRAAKKRAETPVVGDLNPMTAALAELDSIMQSSQPRTADESKVDTADNCGNKPTKLRGKKLQKQILNDIECMKAALSTAPTVLSCSAKKS